MILSMMLAGFKLRILVVRPLQLIPGPHALPAETQLHPDSSSPGRS
ncbi:MAG: hypothetical protein MZV64_04125 [Ignavibacteriales bacterium]|nr:hypothetical protein [Ignavibacteriales bacterium]